MNLRRHRETLPRDLGLGMFSKSTRGERENRWSAPTTDSYYVRKWCSSFYFIFHLKKKNLFLFFLIQRLCTIWKYAKLFQFSTSEYYIPTYLVLFDVWSSCALSISTLSWSANKPFSRSIPYTSEREKSSTWLGAKTDYEKPWELIARPGWFIENDRVAIFLFFLLTSTWLSESRRSKKNMSRRWLYDPPYKMAYKTLDNN